MYEANTTQARAIGPGGRGAEQYALRGHKWFFSAPMCDAHLVVAAADGAPTCFLLCLAGARTAAEPGAGSASQGQGGTAQQLKR